MLIHMYDVDKKTIVTAYVSPVIPRNGEFIRLQGEPYRVVDVEHSVPIIVDGKLLAPGQQQDKVTLLVKKV